MSSKKRPREVSSDEECEAFAAPIQVGLSPFDKVKNWCKGDPIDGDLSIICETLCDGKGSARRENPPENPLWFSRRPTHEPTKWDYSIPEDKLSEILQLPSCKGLKQSWRRGKRLRVDH